MQTLKTAFIVVLLLAVLYGAHTVITQPPPRTPREAAEAARELPDSLQFDEGSVDLSGAVGEPLDASPADPDSPDAAPPRSASRLDENARPLIPPPAGVAADEPAERPESLTPPPAEFAAGDAQDAPLAASDPAGANDARFAAGPGERLAAVPPPAALGSAPAIPDLAPQPDALAETAAPPAQDFAPPADAPADDGGYAPAPSPPAGGFPARPVAAGAGAAATGFAAGGGAFAAAPAGGAPAPAYDESGSTVPDAASPTGGAPESEPAFAPPPEAPPAESAPAGVALPAPPASSDPGPNFVEGVRFDPKDALLSRGWRSAQDSIKSGQWRQALATLSAMYEDPRLSHEERQRLLDSLDPLAAKVVYSTEHLLEPAHEVRRGETLMTLGEKYQVPWQLLQNVNGVADPEFLVPGTKLKVLRGPFRADVDLAGQEITLYLQKLYAGRFPISVGADPAPRPGDYEVQRKDTGRPFYAPSGVVLPAGDAKNPYGRCWIDLGFDLSIHGSALEAGGPATSGCIGLSPKDATDVLGILSVGSRVSIR